MVHDYTDSLTLVSHVNSSLEQTCRDNIAYCLDNKYHGLKKKCTLLSQNFFWVMIYKKE